ncbi:hypothetical protein BCR39DRAFT_549915 [Naematelia encephala]|uniref:Zn(2)-C6 fungal-type domain-containing protein n=1 Tax=Naematelia encephala TaxID=71784 RepID=A0A1Y2AKP9_9TREE|nr:hypothetical protein BCR39DRAFT_549915 [Naematelia encephala]
MEAGPIRRTIHACVQCRERKQKCGGVTAQATCVACAGRHVRCSFEDEARDPRFNPYLRIQSVPLRESNGSVGAAVSQQTPAVGSTSNRQQAQVSPAVSQDDMANRLRYMQDRLRALEDALQTQQRPSPDSSQQRTAKDSFTSPVANDGFVPHIEGQFETAHKSPQISTGSHVEMAQIPVIQSSPRMPTSDSTSPSTRFNGPMKVLQDLGTDDAIDMENHDPISRQFLTFGEASVAFNLFFSKCHPNAPFLDSRSDMNMKDVRSRNIALFLNIVVVGARFWGQSSKKDSWLHPRYTSLVSLLDREMTRLILRPRPADLCLETVQAWMIYSHWMPVDKTPNAYRSRFSESSVWHCLGLAIRWAVLLGLDSSAHLPFVNPTHPTTLQDARVFRTMMYLTESDHYLAISARKPPTLAPSQIFHALPRYLRSEWVQPTDTRLASLLRVVQAVHVMGDRADCAESVEAFNHDVDAVESDFLSSTASINPGFDKMGQHFPFTSLRWYRLAFASTILPPAGNWRNAGEPFRMSVEWASQILFHLSSSASMSPLHLAPGFTHAPLEPDEDLVQLLSFAIDQYFVVIAYTASFLVLAWQSGAIDNQLQMRGAHQDGVQSDVSPRQSPLYRLVDLTSRTLERCSPARGHLASLYTELTRGMANIVAAGAFNPSSTDMGQQDQPGGSLAGVDGAGVWDSDWLNLWQDSGLDSGWLFGNVDESNSNTLTLS